MTTTDPTTTAFVAENGRLPREGDFYVEDTEMLRGSDGTIGPVTTCWDFTGGRWEGFVSLR